MGSTASTCVFASHHWPTWGRERAVEFLAMQRDMYLYLHDQTLRLMNQGHVGAEIAEMLEMPPALEAAWHTHGYYGSISHNVKAIYQRYLGWYDGNPAHLWPHPPAEAAAPLRRRDGRSRRGARRGPAAPSTRATYRWAVEVLNHLLFADDADEAAKALLADAFEQLGFGSENGTWRSVYLAGATELRSGIFGTPTTTDVRRSTDALTVTQVFDSIAIRIDGPRAWDEHLTLCWVITDEGSTYVTELRNGALNHRASADPAPGSTTFSLDRRVLIGLVTRAIDFATALGDGSVQVEGDAGDLQRLVSLLAPVDPDFAVVLP